VVRLSVNAILPWGEWVTAGDPIPAADLPKHFERYIAKPEDQDLGSGEQQPANLDYVLGTSYSVDSRGYRHLQRQVSELASISSEEEAVQQAIEDLDHDPVISEAMQQAQQDHDAHVKGQIAQAQADANRQDAAKESALLEQEQAVLDADGFQVDSQKEQNLSAPVVPPAESKPKPKRRLRKRFVRRGSVWMRTKQIKHFRIGEPVFIKENKEFIQCGVVNKNKRLPAIYIKD
jgi:hypothetical protein